MFLLLYQTVLILKTSQYFVALSEKKKKKRKKVNFQRLVMFEKMRN